MKKSGFFISHVHSTVLNTFLLIFSFALVSACGKTKIEIISYYDAKAYDQTQQLKSKVDNFIVSLLEKDKADREFSKSESQYQEIAASLTQFSAANKARSKNSESIKIAQSLVALWTKYQADHKAKNTYDDGTVKLNRSRFIRLFDLAAKAELAKKRK